MKKILLGLGFCLLGFFAQAQNGLEGIIVEKYYISNAADATGSSGVLPAGSVTYRIYADMLPGYKFQMAYGDEFNALKLTTTTTFFNNEDYGSTTPGFNATNAKKNTVMLDSWLSVGAAHTGKLGVMKSEDDGVGTYVNTNGLLANTDAAMGILLTAQDGIYSGATAPEAVTFVGIGTETDVFGDGSANGNSFILTNAAWSSLNGAVGPLASNKVLIAQITTDGVFHYELNIQIGTPSGDVEKYVVANPRGGQPERTIPSLVGTLGGVNTLPAITVSAPVASSVPGDNVIFTAVPTDADGTITNVVFKVDGSSVATVASAPWTYTYTSVIGVHSITAVATDDQGGVTTSAPFELTVSADPAPIVSITAPVTGTDTKQNYPVTITATATDNVSISQVEFFVDGVSLLVDNTFPYSATYPASVLGNHTITAVATDNMTQSTTSAGVSILVKQNVPPTVIITAPATSSNVTMGNVVALTATAADTDGTVASVEFKVDGVSVGIDALGPFSIDWTPSIERNGVVIIAIATDNDGTTTNSSISVNVNDPNGLPYVIGEVTQACYINSVCLPVSSTKAAMTGVIGYDMELKYDATKVTPTGVVTVSNQLINPAHTSVITNIDVANSVLNITIFLNGEAVTNFAGEGQLLCAEFNKLPAFDQADQAVFSMEAFNESYTDRIEAKLVKTGKLITFKDVTFEGSLKFWKDNSAIKYNPAIPGDYLVTNIFGSLNHTNAVQPDINGNFLYNITNGTSISIERDIINTTDVHSVIMGNDALAAAQIANKNTTAFTPDVFAMIAADVNGDGVVSAGDASQINLRAAMNIGEFKQAWNALNGQPSKDWLFVNSATLLTPAYQISANYPNDDLTGFSKSRVPVVSFLQSLPAADYVSCINVGSDVYTGIMLGDVNGSYKDIVNNGFLKSAKLNDGNEDLVILDFSKAVVDNNVVTVPVSVKTSLNELHAIDLGIIINDAKIENIEIAHSSNFSSLNLGYNAGTRKLNIAGFNTNSIPTNNSFSLEITKRNSDALVASDFDGVQVNLTDNPMGVINNGKLKVIDQTTGITDFNNNSIEVYPNPAKDNLTVKVSEDSNVQMYDLNSKLHIETNVKAGQNNVIDVQNFRSGVYMMRVISNGKSSIHKVVIQK